MNIGQFTNIPPEVLGQLFAKPEAQKLFKPIGDETSTELDLMVGNAKRRYKIIVRELPLDWEHSFWEVELYKFIQELLTAIKNKDIDGLYQKYRFKELQKNGNIRISRFTLHGFTSREVKKMFRIYGLEFENRLAMPSEQSEVVPASYWNAKNKDKPIQVPTLVLEHQTMWGKQDG